MAKRQILECDRCLKEIKGPPHFELHISWHHPRTLVLCGPCERRFREWLYEPHPGTYHA